MKYTAVIGSTATGFSAHFPDLPGCIATAATREQLDARLHEVLTVHLGTMRRDGLEIPDPDTRAVEIAA
jgi:predicted RNase H-like HicB family nuclease